MSTAATVTQVETVVVGAGSLSDSRVSSRSASSGETPYRESGVCKAFW